MKLLATSGLEIIHRILCRLNRMLSGEKRHKIGVRAIRGKRKKEKAQDLIKTYDVTARGLWIG